MNEPLKNINVLLTRTKHQSLESIMVLTNLGANVISFPTIRISTIKNNSYLDSTILGINKFNTLIFTSENAVKSLIEKIDELNVDFDPKSFFVISIGGKTSEICEKFGFRVDFQAKQFKSDSMIKELSLIDLVGRKILVPSSSLSKKNQFDVLNKSGAQVTQLPIYFNTTNSRNSLKEEITMLENTNIDLYIFTSPSTFNSFLEILKIDDPIEYFEDKQIAVIGPVTESALTKCGLKADIMPSNHTMNYLIEEIKNYYIQHKLLTKKL